MKPHGRQGGRAGSGSLVGEQLTDLHGRHPSASASSTSDVAHMSGAAKYDG